MKVFLSEPSGGPAFLDRDTLADALYTEGLTLEAFAGQWAEREARAILAETEAKGAHYRYKALGAERRYYVPSYEALAEALDNALASGLLDDPAGH